MQSLKFSLISISLFFFLSLQDCYPGIKICSWNLKDIGNSKNPVEIEFISAIIQEFDVVAIQEVVPGEGGQQAIIKLWSLLNKTGSAWEYAISDPTFSSSYKTERYAYFWKTEKLRKVGDTWLEQHYKSEIDREPFYIRFSSEGKEFILVNFHAITKSNQPETEIKYFKFLPAEYSGHNLIFCGDFNCPESHSVFNPLKSMGFKPALKGQKTSLRQQCINGDCLASEFDNIFYNQARVVLISAGIIHFYRKFKTIDEARLLSDHVPVYFEFSLK
jgi:deoxyribonuclease-1-like protein